MKTISLMKALLLAATLACTPLLHAKSITLPADGMPLKESELPGYAKAKMNCLMCHSAEYMRYQPPTAPRPYWEGVVKRMKQVFNAPVNDADVPDIVDYLVKTYGSELAK